MRRLLANNADWAVAGIVVIVLVVWFAGQRCDGGEPFSRAPAHDGPGPRPIAVFGLDSTTPDYVNGGTGAAQRPPPESVQLVGCIHSTGSADLGAADSCRYLDGSTTTIRQGRYRVNVFEARTGRSVTAVAVEGTKDCQLTHPRPHVDEHDVIATKPGNAAYASAFERLISG